MSDQLFVRVYDTSGHLLSTLATYTNLDALPHEAYWYAHSLDMTPYIGQKVSIRFVGVNNDVNTTQWQLDDVSLNVQ